MIGAMIILALGKAVADDKPGLSTPDKTTRTAQKRLSLELAADFRFPAVPEKLWVYRVKWPKVDKEWVSQLARRLFKTPVEVKKDSTGYLASGEIDETIFRLWVREDTGFFELEDRRFYEPQSEIRNVGDFPNAENAQRIALAFLKNNQLFPEDVTDHDFSCYAAGTGEGGDVMSVGLGRRINGVEFWDSRDILVHIGRSNRVVSVYRAWPKLVPVRECRIMAPAQAVEEVNKGKGRFFSGPRPEGIIVDMTLVYETKLERQQEVSLKHLIIEPVYYFHYRHPDGSMPGGMVDAIEGAEKR